MTELLERDYEHGTGAIIEYHLYSIIELCQVSNLFTIQKIKILDRDIEDWTKKSLDTGVVIRHCVYGGL